MLLETSIDAKKMLLDAAMTLQLVLEQQQQTVRSNRLDWFGYDKAPSVSFDHFEAMG